MKRKPPFSRRAAVLSTLALLFQLSACAPVGPSFRPPKVDPPDRWTALAPGVAGTQAPLPANRWTAFQDPVLLRLQALAAQANQDVKVAVLRLMQARVNEATVSAQRGPRLDARGAAMRQRQSESGSATRVAGALGGGVQQQVIGVLSEPFSVYQAGFDASWEPDLWGRVARSEESAGADSDGQRALLRHVQLSVSADVARQYFQLRSAQQQRRLIGDELALALDVQQVLDAQWRGGLSDQSALVKQRSLVAGLQASLPALDAQEALASNQIALLCAANPAALHNEVAAGAAPIEAPELPDLRLGLPSELVRSRPDLLAAEASLHAATANIGLAIADLYPRISIGASVGLESVDSGKFGEWGSRQWSVGPSLSIPLFDRGRRHAIVTLRELQQQQAAVAYQQAVLKAWHEVDDAIATYLAESRRGAQLTLKAGFSGEEAQLARIRFSNGMTNYLPLSNAEMAVLEARRELADNRGRRNTALTALFKALGDDGSAAAAAK